MREGEVKKSQSKKERMKGYMALFAFPPPASKIFVHTS